MAGRRSTSVAGILRHAPIIGVGLAVYQHYSEIGFGEIITDLKNLTIDDLKANIDELLLGIGLFVAGSTIVRYLPAKTRKIALGVIYYIATDRVIEALQNGGSIAAPPTKAQDDTNLGGY